MEGEWARNGISGRETNGQLLEKHKESRPKAVIWVLKGKGKDVYRYYYVSITRSINTLALERRCTNSDCVPLPGRYRSTHQSRPLTERRHALGT